MDIYELIRKYESNYSTLKHILMQYNQFGKTDRRQFKHIQIKDQAKRDLIKKKIKHDKKISSLTSLSAPGNICG